MSAATSVHLAGEGGGAGGGGRLTEEHGEQGLWA